MNDRQSTPDILGNMLSPEQAERTELAQALRYDYSQLGAQADEVRDHAIEIKRHEKRASAAIIEGGRHLIAVKESLAHGQWMDWLAVEFNMTDRTARTMMAIAERFDGENGNKISDLNPTVLGMLAAPSVPEEAVKAVVSASSDGKVSVAQAKQIIAEYRPARLSEGDLATIVQTWMAGFWRRPWPENPSHTNGTLWMELTAWMHGNVQQPWQESDLKTVIKRLHYAHVQQWSTPNRPPQPANRPTPQPETPTFALVLSLQGAANRVWDALNPNKDPDIDKQLGQVARQAIVNKGGDFWERCKAEIERDYRAWRHEDMRQAIALVIKRHESGAAWVPPGTGARLYATPSQEPFVPTKNKPEPGVWVPPTLEEFNARPRVTGALDLQDTVDMCWDLQYGKVADPVTTKANIKQARYEADHQGRFFVFCHESADDELRPFTDHTLTLAIQIYCDKLEATLRQSNPELFPAVTWRSAEEEEEEEKTIDRADFGIAEPDEDQDEAPVPELVEGMSGLLLRQQQIGDVRDRLIDAITAVKQAGELTGKHTVTLGADRELRRVIQLLDDELEAISKGATHREYA